jgi:DNA-directed RNA polymerase specialized sigma24 family protein
MVGGVEDIALDAKQIFGLHRSALCHVASGILGETAPIEAVLQETLHRWLQVSNLGTENARAFLVSTVAMLCLDRLQHIEGFVESRMPPCPRAPGFQSSSSVRSKKSVSNACLRILDRLAPAERVVFLLRTVFDCEYRRIAQTTGKDETECRRIVQQVKKIMVENRSGLGSVSSTQGNS